MLTYSNQNAEVAQLLKEKAETQQSYDKLHKKYSQLQLTYSQMSQTILDGYNRCINDDDTLTPVEMYMAIEAYIVEARVEIESLKTELGNLLLE